MDSQVWASNFARFGPQVIGRTMFDYGYPNWGENPPFHAPVGAAGAGLRGVETIQGEGAVHLRYEVR